MIKEKVLNTIKEYNLIKTGDTIVIGVSGGPDSMTLVSILQQMKKEKVIDCNLYVAHVNHNIRKEAMLDQEYVEHYCKQNNLTCFSKQIDVEKMAKQQKIGTEEAGRIARYAFFDEIEKKVQATKIATAHTANDNAETIMMNLLRGSGITGLKGIEPIRNTKYIRPLIECTRTEIEDYCEKQTLNPRLDQTNLDNRYTRNKIRNELLPYMEKEFNPNIISTLNRLAVIVRQENAFLEQQTTEQYQQIVIEEQETQISLDLKKFNALDLVIKNRIVLYTINRLFGSSNGIEKVHIQDIIKLCSNNIGNKFLIPNKKVKVLVKNKKIILIQNEIFRK